MSWYMDEAGDISPDELERISKMMDKLITFKRTARMWTKRGYSESGVMHMKGGGTITFLSTPESRNMRWFNDKYMG